MNLEQATRMRMFLNTQAALDHNTNRWNSIPIMVQVKNELDELIQRIEDKNEETISSSKGTTAQKDLLRRSLVEKAVTISGILQAYFAYEGDKEQEEQVKLSKWELMKCRETDVEAKVAPVIKVARAQLETLADFALTEDMLIETETTIDSFNALIGKPRTIRNQVFAAIDAIDNLVKQADGLIRDRLDKLMIRFEFTDPNFYNEYTRARVIVD